MSQPSFKNILRSNIGFMLPWCIFFTLGSVVAMMVPKKELHLWFNQHHSLIGDALFPYITKMAEGWMIFPVVALLLFVRFRYSLYFTVSILTSSLLAQFLKRVVFPDFDRPSRVFAEAANFHWVDGVHLNGAFSFPSGHTTSAFTIFMVITLLMPTKKWHALLFLLALLIGFSRIYLSQHFFMDVVAGSFLGGSIPLLLFNWFMHPERSAAFPWLDKKLGDKTSTS